MSLEVKVGSVVHLPPLWQGMTVTSSDTSIVMSSSAVGGASLTAVKTGAAWLTFSAGGSVKFMLQVIVTPT